MGWGRTNDQEVAFARVQASPRSCIRVRITLRDSSESSMPMKRCPSRTASRQGAPGARIAVYYSVARIGRVSMTSPSMAACLLRGRTLEVLVLPDVLRAYFPRVCVVDLARVARFNESGRLCRARPCSRGRGWVVGVGESAGQRLIALARSLSTKNSLFVAKGGSM